MANVVTGALRVRCTSSTTSIVGAITGDVFGVGCSLRSPCVCVCVKLKMIILLGLRVDGTPYDIGDSAFDPHGLRPCGSKASQLLLGPGMDR
jgi:hypothetical protein